VLDAGVEGHALYTADITRVLPIGGKVYAGTARDLHVVLEAQAAGIRAVRPGNDFLEPNRAAMQVLSEGLHRLGILKTHRKRRCGTKTNSTSATHCTT